MVKETIKYFVGIDIGTTSTKAVIFDPMGNVLKQHSVGYDMFHPFPNWSEQNPEEIYEAFQESLSKVVTPDLAAESIISFSSAMHSLIAVDETGKPLTNLMLWADNRASEIASKLRLTDLGKELYAHTGIPIHSFSMFAKMLWFKENEPELFAKTHKFLGIKEYLWFRMFGEYTIDYSLASGSGLFNFKDLAWDELALETLGISAEQLPDLVPITHIKNTTNTELPLVNYVIGAGDGPLANLGSNAMEAGQMAFTMGTSGAVRMAVPQPYIDPHMRTFNFFFFDNQYIIGGATNNGGVVLQWFEEDILCTKDSTAHILEEAEKLAIGSDNLLFLPYILGDRAPIWNANARGVFFGLSITHTQAHLVRAIMEGLILNMYTIGKIVMEQQTVNEICATGGFAKSNFLLQLVADVFQKKVVVCETVEGSAWGACLVAMKALEMPYINNTLSEGKVFYPNVAHASTFAALHQRFERLYDKLEG